MKYITHNVRRLEPKPHFFPPTLFSIYSHDRDELAARRQGAMTFLRTVITLHLFV
jgi:hypothetical protein